MKDGGANAQPADEASKQAAAQVTNQTAAPVADDKNTIDVQARPKS
jgi:hypothetical protein